MKEIKFESNVDYLTKLDNFDFEGPLDLLLHLIKEAKIEIKDVFVSSVTDQFLQYIERNLEALDIDKASEYLTMAATLLEIKSKSLLPKIEDIEIDIEDPEKALIRKVEEYKLFKETAEKLKNCGYQLVTENSGSFIFIDNPEIKFNFENMGICRTSNLTF